MMRQGIRVWLIAASLAASVLAACTDDSGPAITGSPALTATVGRSYRFQPQAINMGKAGRDVSFAIANKPAWATFDASTGQLSGTPSPDHLGVFADIQISAAAGAVHAALPSFSITVVPAAATVSAGNGITLSWDAPTDNTDGSFLSNLSGYKIYYGGASGDYSSTIKVANPGLTTYVVERLSPGKYYFAVTAYNSLGEESDFSPEMSTMVN